MADAKIFFQSGCRSLLVPYFAHSHTLKFRGEVAEWDEALATDLTSVSEWAAEWQLLLR
jgi:hypothetical protein